jgi:outer membrane receptor for ferrienterochelin and colicin
MIQKRYAFFLSQDTVLDVSLSTLMLQEVILYADELTRIQDLTQMSSFDIPVQQLKTMPAMAGEVDIMKSLQLLPGVQAGNEGTSGLYVRGGGPDQNLILLDGVPVYNASHLFGFFSVFNADAINHVELIKGGFPARYGGRLSSVIDINMKEGNDQEIKGEGSFGLIASRLTVEGPVKKGKSSFIVSARRTYADLLLRPVLAMQGRGDLGYYFYDLNAKFNFKPDPRNRFYFSIYGGQDKGFSKNRSSSTDNVTAITIDQKDKAKMKWGNIVSALRWNHVLSPKLFSNVTATYSQYGFEVSARNETFTHHPAPNERETYNELRRLYQSGIEDYSIKVDFDFTPSPNHYIRFGGYSTRHAFRPGASELKSNQLTVIRPSPKITNVEFGGYVEDDIIITRRLKANAGVHFSGLSVVGKTFFSVQPRVSARYMVTDKLSAKASYSQMTQFIHLLTNGGIGLPTDLWVPATAKIKPQESVQIATGIAYVPNSTYEVTVEAYHKTMDGVIEYKEGAGYISTSNNWEGKVESGKGESYGLELFVQKKQGKFRGWIGYTLSRTDRQFENLNFGKPFPYRYDRRHDLELNLSRKLTETVDLSATWVYGTGSAASIPLADYATIDDRDNFYDWNNRENLELTFETAGYYGGRNGYRMRDFHRLDMSLSFKRQRKWGERAWVISVYNVYSRQNPFYLEFNRDPDGNKKLYEHGLFPIIPSISYNFKF